MRFEVFGGVFVCASTKKKGEERRVGQESKKNRKKKTHSSQKGAKAACRKEEPVVDIVTGGGETKGTCVLKSYSHGTSLEKGEERDKDVRSEGRDEKGKTQNFYRGTSMEKNNESFKWGNRMDLEKPRRVGSEKKKKPFKNHTYHQSPHVRGNWNSNLLIVPVGKQRFTPGKIAKNKRSEKEPKKGRCAPVKFCGPYEPGRFEQEDELKRNKTLAQVSSLGLSIRV